MQVLFGWRNLHVNHHPMHVCVHTERERERLIINLTDSLLLGGPAALAVVRLEDLAISEALATTVLEMAVSSRMPPTDSSCNL